MHGRLVMNLVDNNKGVFKMTTLRILLPQWQGGVNPNYVLGAELLAIIAPPSEKQEQVVIEVNRDYQAPLDPKYGVDKYSDLLKQTIETSLVLEEKKPNKVIVLGGDCSISQAPFAYLSEKYGKKLGILWLDAHPDIATDKQSTHLHEMVLGNLIGEGAEAFSKLVKAPVSPERVFYAGLIEKDLRSIDNGVFKNKLQFANPDSLKENSEPIKQWVRENEIEVLAVHFDLDVLSPDKFHSIYTADPYSRVEDFPAAVGELDLKQIGNIFHDLDESVDLVGLSIAEHIPWDAINLRKTLSEISIFK